MAFVFLFALNAKLSLCRPVGPENSRTAFKLYLNGQKLTIGNAVVAPSMFLAGIVTALFFAICSLRICQRYHEEAPFVLSYPFDLISDPHFFRPPPRSA